MSVLTRRICHKCGRDGGHEYIRHHSIAIRPAIFGLEVAKRTLFALGGIESLHNRCENVKMIAATKRATIPLFAVPEEVKRWFGSITRSDIPPVHVREWLGDVVRTHYRLLYSIAFGYCHDPSSAEDLVQSAVLSGLSKVNDLRNPEAILAWLATITRNGCLQTLRRHHLTEQLDTAEDIIATSPVEVHRMDEGRLLLEAIAELPDKLASVVRMRFLEELSIAEISDLLGLRRNTVEVRLHRALEQLAKKPALQALRGEL